MKSLEIRVNSTDFEIHTPFWGVGDPSKPPAKRKSKIMNVTERKSLLDSRDNTILSAVVKANDLKQQLLADQLKKLLEALCTNDQLLKTPASFFYVAFHSLSRSRFPPSTRFDSTYLSLSL